MQKLILVRHSQTEMNPAIPANRWHLSAEGRRRCRLLGERLLGYQPAHLISSMERKAVETAEILSEVFKKKIEIFADLHEHERDNVGFLSPREFSEAIAGLFREPDRLIFGTETTDRARLRFSKAISKIEEKYGSGNLVVVSHATVISLFIAAHNNLDAYSFWQRLGMPAFAVLALPGFKLIRLVEEIAFERD